MDKMKGTRTMGFILAKSTFRPHPQGLRLKIYYSHVNTLVLFLVE